MLFVKCAVGDYYYMVGGGVHMGETSQACIEREVYEKQEFMPVRSILRWYAKTFLRVKAAK